MRFPLRFLIFVASVFGFGAANPSHVGLPDGNRGLPEVWLEIPEAGSRVEANGFIDLSMQQISYLQLHISTQPSQVTYGSIHVKVNTESANTILTITSKPD